MESESAQKPQPYTVLCVDGDARSLRLLEVGLGRPAIAYSPRRTRMKRWRSLLPSRRNAVVRGRRARGFHGFMLVQRLRLYPGWGTVPVLFLVDHDCPSQRMRAYEQGGEAIQKPLFLKEALARVEVLLEKAALRGDPIAGQASQPRFAGYLDGTSLIDSLESTSSAAAPVSPPASVARDCPVISIFPTAKSSTPRSARCAEKKRCSGSSPGAAGLS